MLYESYSILAEGSASDHRSRATRIRYAAIAPLIKLHYIENLSVFVSALPLSTRFAEIHLRVT